MKHICMKTFAVAALATLSATASAQVKTGAFVEIGPAVNVGSSGGESADNASSGKKKKAAIKVDVPEVKESSKVALELLGGYLWGLTDNAALGFAAGLSENCKFNAAPNIPVMARLKYAFGGTDQTVPFAMMDLGADLNLDNFDATAIRVNPTVGLDMGNFYFGVGYLCGIATSGGTASHNINFKLGYNFDSKAMQSKAMQATMRFIKKTYVRVDVGYGMGLSKNEGSKEEITFGDHFSVQAAWMYPLNEYLHVGIGTGYDDFTAKEDAHDGESYHVATVPFYLRGQFYVMETDFGLRPFVACNIGARAKVGTKEEAECNTFFVEPQVGVEYKKFSFTAGYGVTSWKWNDEGYDDETLSGNSLNLRVGYRF